MTMMIPVIMNTSFQRLAMIDDYVSFIWTERFYNVGDFELVVSTGRDLSMFRKGYYVVRDNDDGNAGIVENLKIQSDEDGNEVLIITGRFLPAILERRIIAVQTTVQGTVSYCVNHLIETNLTNPQASSRKISNFIIGNHSVSATMKAQYTGKNLLDTVVDVCKTYGVGFRTLLNDNHQFVFDLYEGADHTYDQNVLPYVVFSDKYDNLLSSEYEENYESIATAVLVAGEGEGRQRKTKWVTTGATGMNRYEVYKDQRNLQSDDGEISESEYYDLLEESGKESLTKYTSAFSGSVSFDNVKYRQDVNLGDLCVIENSKWGLRTNARLVEVIESVSEAGVYSIRPTFGV